MNVIPTSDGGQSPVSRILMSMQDDHSRYLLYYLEEEDPCHLDEAARHVSAWDHDCDPTDVPPKLHNRIKRELYHIHLPKLDEMNMIEYDDRSGVIRSHNLPSKLTDFLDLAREEDID